ncbi:glycoside hydrolase family 5 [Cellulomonas flavigena DSM 20109]|uniref:Glycoside hydrolase family 5 n=1 Tax=Cellulomonas flavigena (strain ATCC 482 / DSM 20109 / BCRC 11376 / JCM 18109 / NBRC 3775 / NCIMB 8073 / NRS 134) TaxID=446466 RepID=D5UJC4_CELFN|nr:cellulase family glycosylhydrolase [Cellulomonas flavigena]ADG73647.1 glycoside hydrolase family 5 [Cellulomonas flavigena DSM 20109]
MAAPRRPRHAAATLAVLTALVTALLAPAPAVAATDPSGGNTPATGRPASGVERWGDGSYLNGFSYLRGVNVYSLVFGGDRPAHQVGESQASWDYLASRGVKVARLPVSWVRLQPVPASGNLRAGLDGPVSQAYLDVVEEQVRRAARAGIRTVVGLHNACSYPNIQAPGSVVCGDGVTRADVAKVWTALAGRFAGDERVVAFDLLNETHIDVVPVARYRLFTQAAADAVRATGAQQTLWVQRLLGERGRLDVIAPDGPWVADPLGKVMYSQHFYSSPIGAVFDPLAGNHAVLMDVDRFGTWCRRWNVRCAAGEVGWPSGGPGGVQSAASARGWNLVFEQFYRLADQYGLDVTYFAASSSQTTGTLLAYVASRPGYPSPTGLDTALSQTEVIERHLSRRAR